MVHFFSFKADSLHLLNKIFKTNNMKDEILGNYIDDDVNFGGDDNREVRAVVANIDHSNLNDVVETNFLIFTFKFNSYGICK